MSNVKMSIEDKKYLYEQPWFYNNKLALRCELGVGNGVKYLKNAVQRALEIFNILFNNEVPDCSFFHEYIYNDSTLINFESSSNYIGVLRGATLTLQVQPSFENGTKILLDRGTTLIINGFTANLDFLHPYPGCKIILRNGAKIKKPFSTPIGVEFVIEDGTIE